MSDNSTILGLPYIQPSQAQKHVTHNDALEILDVLVQAAAKARQAAPPAVPEPGDRYIVTATATDDWAGHETKLAVYEDSGQGWRFFEPQIGWRVYVEDEASLYFFDGTHWFAPDALPETVGKLGISTTADTVNRLAVASAASLFTHSGADHQIKVNKASATDTASLLFQDNWSGRAEMGIAGSDDFEIKVSADGSSFHSALRAARATGIVTLPQGAAIGGLVTGAAVQSGATDTTAGRLLAVGAFGLGGTAPVIGNASVTTGAIAPGFYGYDNTQGSSGGPSEVSQGILLHQRRASSAEMQTLWCEAGTAPSGALFSRVRTSAGWSAWRAGGVIEGTTTAQGRYRRHQDGTQTCWQSVTTLTTGELSVTFPAAFSTTTDLVTTLGVNATTVGVVCPRFTGRTATGLSLSAFNSANTRVAVSVDVMAVGRWY